MKRYWVGLLALVLSASDWPQWRGPNRDGVAAGALHAPVKWPDQLRTQWKVTVGEGHSSPILAGGRIFQFTRLNDQETLHAIDPGSGRILWKQSYAAPYTMSIAAMSHGKGPKSTPVYADGRVYALGISGILTCFKASDGAVVWRKEFGRQFPETSPDYGTAMSPMVWNGLLIAYVGGGGGGALIAFDVVSGAEKWRWSGDGPGYASPVVGIFDKVPQLITQSQKNILAVNALTGELLWRNTFQTGHDQNAVTPVVARDLVVYSGQDNGITALRPVHKGPIWVTEQIWHVNDAAFYMNSPVLTPSGSLIGFSHKSKGQFVALDPMTGAIQWRSNGRQGDNASLVAAGDLLFLLTNESELTVLPAASGKFEPLKRYTVAESAVWAHPLVLESGIVVKDVSTLRLLSWN